MLMRRYFYRLGNFTSNLPSNYRFALKIFCGFAAWSPFEIVLNFAFFSIAWLKSSCRKLMQKWNASRVGILERRDIVNFRRDTSPFQEEIARWSLGKYGLKSRWQPDLESTHRCCYLNRGGMSILSLPSIKIYCKIRLLDAPQWFCLSISANSDLLLSKVQWKFVKFAQLLPCRLKSLSIGKAQPKLRTHLMHFEPYSMFVWAHALNWKDLSLLEVQIISFPLSWRCRIHDEVICGRN